MPRQPSRLSEREFWLDIKNDLKQSGREACYFHCTSDAKGAPGGRHYKSNLRHLGQKSKNCSQRESWIARKFQQKNGEA